MTHNDGTQALFSRIQALLAQKERAALALDGMAASGKTTLAAGIAARIPSSAVVHMDDFTLPFEKRFPGYYEALGANADVTRFDSEVLTPFLSGSAAVYRPYICHPEPGFLPPVTVPAGTRLLIVEGAYCLHSTLFDRFDLRALKLIDPQTQRRRILARNGEAGLSRFLDLWIPMENSHIEKQQLEHRCDLVIR